MKLLTDIEKVADPKAAEYEKDLIRQATQPPTYEEPEAFMQVPFDETFIRKSIKLKEEITGPNLKYIVVVGIGGSDLGTKAIYEALYGFFDDIEPERFPKMIFLETTNPHQLEKINNFLISIKNPENVLINVISKSGETLETITNMEVLLKNVPYAQKRLVVTTGETSKLHDEAESLGVRTLDVPESVGGRYSVFTTVGIFPLVCAGIDVTKILEGAMKAVSNDIASRTANFIFKNYRSGKTIHDLFVFEPELESLGEWYEQLMAESLGKQGKGITPMTSIGSGDLHSDAQLDVGGPKDKMFTFVWADYKKIQKFKEHQQAGEVKRAILSSAMNMFRNHEIPILEIEFNGVSEMELGEFMQTKMMEIAIIGKLMGVNAFNQPNVEEYKDEAEEILND